MDEIKKIIYKVYLLILDISLFSFKTFRELILPSRGKKGNILSTIFIFFVGLVERLDNFEYGVFRMSVLFRRKYIKQSLLLVASLLFLISSIEWREGKKLIADSAIYTQQFSGLGVIPTNENNQRQVAPISANPFLLNEVHVYKNILEIPTPVFPSLKTYLLIRCFRI